jgi:hypothetical protein
MYEQESHRGTSRLVEPPAGNTMTFGDIRSTGAPVQLVRNRACA